MRMLINENSLQKRISEMALEIDSYYQRQDWYRKTDEPVIVIGVLAGAIFFMADLVRQLSIRTKLDFIRTSTYPGKTTTAKEPQIIATPKISLHDAHVLLIDDILDTGQTMLAIRQHIMLPYPEDIRMAVLLRKPEKIQTDISADFVGFDIPDEWVAGYGMDDRYGQRREVQCIFVNGN